MIRLILILVRIAASFLLVVATHQLINAANLTPGLWKVRLDWTARGEAFAFEQTILVGG